MLLLVFCLLYCGFVQYENFICSFLRHFVVLFMCTFHLVTHSSLAQVRGEWKTRDVNMSKHCSEARKLKSQFKSFEMEHVPRV